MDRGKNEEPLNEPALSPNLVELETALRQSRPLAPQLDRDRVMFLAGQASVTPAVQVREHGSWQWRGLTFVSTSLAACLAIALMLELGRPPTERIIVREVEVPAASPKRPIETAPADSGAATIAMHERIAPTAIPLSLPEGSILQMRNMALRWGVESLPQTSATASIVTEPTSRDLWKELRDQTPSRKSESSM